MAEVKGNPFQGNPTVRQEITTEVRAKKKQAAAAWQKRVDDCEAQGLKPGNPFNA